MSLDGALGPDDLVARLIDGRRVRHLVTGEVGSGKSWFAAERIEIHRKIADAAHAAGLDELELRHRAAAGIGIDDALADQLERAGHESIRRGAPLTAAEAFRQAALTTSRQDDRTRRVTHAANEAFAAGNSEQAVPNRPAMLSESADVDLC